MRGGLVAWVWGAVGLLGCQAGLPEGGAAVAGRLGVSVAALSLEGVGDVVWDVEVVNGRVTPGPEVVWQRRISSSGYGDGAGSASYVGPCDAEAAVAENTVRVWVVGVYAEPVTTLGVFASGAGGGVAGEAMAFQNPTTVSTPLTRKVACVENADAAVTFDVALMRPAQQGFFDIAVNFNNIFCSAKFDCCADADGDGCESGEDIALLFDAGGSRSTTLVLGFACTAGARAGVETELYLDALELDCTSPTNFTTGFAADLTLNPAGPAGNQCAAGSLSGCAAVSESGVDADTYLYQVGVYRGLEQLTSGGVAAQKVYWNVALGAKRGGAGAGLEDCWLRTRGTADDANGTGAIDSGTVAAGVVYPYVQWAVDLGTCASEPLSFGAPSAMVRTEYTTTAATVATTFAYGFGPSFPAGPTATCGLLGAACPAGFTCTAMHVDASYDAYCYNATTDEVYVPSGTFWMGCNPAVDTSCAVDAATSQGWMSLEIPQHLVTLDAYAIDRNLVTQLQYAGSGSATLPRSGTNWTNARAYCLARGKDLCTEAQWERAARGGCETVTGDCATAMRKYPWGNAAPTCTLANYSGCVGTKSDVGSRPAGASPYGALDMAGNVWEWTRDWNSAYAAGPATNPTGPLPLEVPGAPPHAFEYLYPYFKVFRGGSYNDVPGDVRSGLRYADGNWKVYPNSGWRCCRALP